MHRGEEFPCLGFRVEISKAVRHIVASENSGAARGRHDVDRANGIVHAGRCGGDALGGSIAEKLQQLGAVDQRLSLIIGLTPMAADNQIGDGQFGNIAKSRGAGKQGHD